jgi:predicted nucleic acid-binding protein
VIYLDTSSLLKLLLEEPESEAVRLTVAGEPDVVVSALVELEAAIQLRAGWLGGEYRQSRYRAYVAQLAAFKAMDPFRFVLLPGTVFATAFRQHANSGRIHCRPVDRLHLAAMEELGIRRLMTHDSSQAAGARALGFDVLTPNVSAP